MTQPSPDTAALADAAALLDLADLPALADLAGADAETIAAHFPEAPRHRQLFCNRTLNLRSIKAIGYDMDYTLVHYHVHAWEGQAYAHLRRRLVAQGWPVGDLEFDSQSVIRGLVIDKRLGNVVKANRFGYIKQAAHGTQQMTQEQLREVYSRTLVDLADTGRWMFLNTLFEISEGCMYLQLVDLLDRSLLPGVLGYEELYRRVRHTLDRAHLEGQLKAEILARPDLYVDLDPELPLALLDQRDSGKKLLLITNSEWSYTQAMMSYAFDRYLPAGVKWRDLFALIVVSSRKPSFFTSNNPLYEVVSDDGLLRPCNDNLAEGQAYYGGSAAIVEKSLGLDGDQIAYVGDHMLSDVHQSKKLQQWRTVAIIRELEDEILALEQWNAQQHRLSALMADKARLEHAFSQLRNLRQRQRSGHGPTVPQEQGPRLSELSNTIRERLLELDAEIGPLVGESGALHNPHWGLIMRTGNDKSLFARMVESHADVYTSRVGNLLLSTPYVFLRSPRGTLPHDM